MRRWIVALCIAGLAIATTLHFVGVDWVRTAEPERRGPEVLDGDRTEPAATDGPTAVQDAPDATPSPSDGTILGRVIDEDGAPIAEAHLELRPTEPSEDPTPPGPGTPTPVSADESLANTVTDADGRFRFPDIDPSLEHTLTASSENHVARRLPSVRANEGPVTITLERGVVASGVVLDPSGSPMAGATVVGRWVPPSLLEFRDPAGNWTVIDTTRGSSFEFGARQETDEERVRPRTQTDETGRFTLSGLPRDGFSLVAEFGSFAPSDPVYVRGRLDGLELLLRTGTVVEGRVVDLGGAPVPGAEVRPTSDERSSRTDVEGRFRLDGMTTGPLQIRVLHEGLAFDTQAGWMIREGELLLELLLVLDRTSIVTGRIVDVDEEPVPGVTIRWIVDMKSMERAKPWSFGQTGRRFEPASDPGTTDEDGRFSLAVERAPGQLVAGMLRLSHPEYLVALTEPITVSEDHPRDLGSFRIERAPMIVGRAMDPDGRAVPGASILIVDEDGSPLDTGRWDAFGETANARTDREGRFRTAVPGPGWYEVSASARGLRGTGVTEVTEDAPAAEPLVLELAPLPTIEGRVVDRDGLPCEGVLVHGQRGIRETSTTDSDGRFRLPCRADRSVVPRLGGGWKLIAPVDPLEPGTTGIVLVADAPGRVVATIVEAETGLPIDRFRATHRSHDETSGRESGALHSGLARAVAFHTPDGRFETPPVFAGIVTIVIDAPGYAHGGGTFEVAPAETLEVTIALEREALVRGVVIDRIGEPVVNATISPRLEDHSWLARDGVSGDDGVFEIRSLPADTITLAFRASGCIPFEIGPYALRAGQVLDLGDVRFSGGGAIHGTVRTDDGSAFRWLRLSFGSEDPQKEFTEVPNLDGTYGRGEIPDGTYTVLVEYALEPLDRAGDAPARAFDAGRVSIENDRDRRYDFTVPGHR